MTRSSRSTLRIALRSAITLIVLGGSGATACSRDAAPPANAAAEARTARSTDEYLVHDTTFTGTRELAGIAAPFRQATLSTRLMGTVQSVLVHEGEHVSLGQPLVVIDARDLDAREAQASAGLVDAEAVHAAAVANAGRFRSLFADSAATRVQLESAETALSRADAALRTANGALAELRAVATYATIRAPFAGVITRRQVDPGAFASPGAPLVTMEDPSQLRITVTAAPDAFGTLARGASIRGTIEQRSVLARVEGIVSSGGGLYSINAIVSNDAGAMAAGSAATLAVPSESHRAILVPLALIAREGDLAGVTVRTEAGDIRRWIRLGQERDSLVEVTSGLRSGDRLVVSTDRRIGA